LFELQKSFDYAFVGMGCANSLILMELHRLDLLANKRIVIYEPAEKVANDRTFCFWLEFDKLKSLQLDQLVAHSWSSVKVNSLKAQTLDGKNYYYLRADTLYAHIRDLLRCYDVCWKEQQLEGYPEPLGNIVFDSRPPLFEKQQSHQVRLEQSFYGWMVQTEEAIFDPEVFTMMDFSIPQHDQTQFLYVLPFASNMALIEPTRFGKEIISEQEATALIENFLVNHKTTYQILEKEQGCIPMCSASLQKENLPRNWLRTGAGSGQLKPSTGYSFVRSLLDAQQIVGAVQQKSKIIERRRSAARFAFYDRLLLRILAQKPQLGKRIFTQLFDRNQANEVLDFLDEGTTIGQELRLMATLPIGPFICAALKDILAQFLVYFRRGNSAFYMTLILFILQFYHLEAWSNFILVLGLLTVGLPHGALDHLPNFPLNSTRFWYFIGKYIILGSLLLLIWFVLPPLALILFLTYTAWHFGQADFEHWQRKTNLLSFLWGSIVLTLILVGHRNETLIILNQMGIDLNLGYTFNIHFIGKIGTGLAFLLLIISRKNHFFFSLIQTLMVLFIGFFLPLIPAFGCYFIFQHSLHGWKYLKNNLALSDFQMWKQALPFTLGALLLLGSYMLMVKTPNWGQLFIFLSALSFPHVWYMHKSYSRK